VENHRLDDQQSSDDELAFGLESDKLRRERSKVNPFIYIATATPAQLGPFQAIKDVLCLITTKTELYTPRYEKERDVEVKVPWRHYWQISPGTFVNVTLVYSKRNNWYIVNDYAEDSSHSPIPYEICDILHPYFDNETKEVTKVRIMGLVDVVVAFIGLLHCFQLLLGIEVTDLEQFYYHPFCGLVLDRESLIDRTRMEIGDKKVIWAVHEQGVGTEEFPSNFVIQSIPTDEEMQKHLLD